MFLDKRKCPLSRAIFWSFKIKDYTCVSFNEDIFNYCNRKSDSIWVQIESLLAEKEKSASTPSLRWTCPSLFVRHMTSAPKEPNQNSFYATKKGHQNRCPLSWRRKRDLLLSSLPQNSPLDYFFAKGEHAI